MIIVCYLWANKYRMIENSIISVDAKQVDASNVGRYFRIHDKPGEFLLRQNDDGDFYFICSDDFPIEEVCDGNGWFIAFKTRFNSRFSIGIGLADHFRLEGEAYRAPDETTLGLWRDILAFVFEGNATTPFFPYSNHFTASVQPDGDTCYYIHNYTPVSRDVPVTIDDKKVANLVFRWKEGKSCGLVAKLFALAISRMQFYKEAQNPILIPIPASSRERNTVRFALFCGRLAEYLNIEDGFRAIWIREDRPQLKGTRGRDKTANLKFNRKYIAGKDVFLVDDIITTGESYTQVKDKLYEMGARSVVGLFLGKTV